MNVFTFRSRVFPVATLTALMVVVNLLEMFVVLPIPLFKVGLANMLPLYLIWHKQYKMAFLVNLLRVLIVSLLSGKLFSVLFFLSFSGVLTSTLAMIAIKYLFRNTISIFALSAVGSVINNSAQYLFFILFFGYKDNLFMTLEGSVNGLFSSLLLLSLISGLIIGYLARKLTPITLVFDKQ